MPVYCYFVIALGFALLVASFSRAMGGTPKRDRIDLRMYDDD
jgi:hypothetical protein